MTASDIEILKIYVLLSPVLVFLLGLAAIWIARWQDAREDRRCAQRTVPGE
jgi:hypothetical protein